MYTYNSLGVISLQGKKYNLIISRKTQLAVIFKRKKLYEKKTLIRLMTYAIYKKIKKYFPRRIVLTSSQINAMPRIISSKFM